MRVRRVSALSEGMPQLQHDRRLCLIDGHNLAYRMHFALPPMHTAAGHPTNTAHGFCTKLLAYEGMFVDYQRLVVFDSPGRTFRSEMA